MDDDPPPTKKARVPKVAKVKNKMPAEVQITAEQLLQEAASTKVTPMLHNVHCTRRHILGVDKVWEGRVL